MKIVNKKNGKIKEYVYPDDKYPVKEYRKKANAKKKREYTVIHAKKEAMKVIKEYRDMLKEELGLNQMTFSYSKFILYLIEEHKKSRN